jgi:hypothetical protein
VKHHGHKHDGDQPSEAYEPLTKIGDPTEANILAAQSPDDIAILALTRSDGE